MNYTDIAAELKRIRYEFLLLRGNRLIRDMERAWGRGDKEYRIPPGEYAITRDIPVASGTSVIGAGQQHDGTGTHIHAHRWNPFRPYPYQDESDESDQYGIVTGIANWRDGQVHGAQ